MWYVISEVCEWVCEWVSGSVSESVCECLVAMFRVKLTLIYASFARILAILYDESFKWVKNYLLVRK